MSLANAGIRGAYFTGIALGLRQLISLATTFYVARQLMPEDIGLFTMVMVVIGLAEVIGDVGVATGLVRSQDNTPKVLNTCFWISISIGIFLLLLIIVLAPLASWFYGIEKIAPYLRVAGIGVLINFILPVPMALMQQRLAFKEIAISQTFGSIVGAASAIVLVTSGFSIWGLVFQPIIGNVVILAMYLMYTKWTPRIEFEFFSSKEILTSGIHLLGANIVSYIRSTFDAIFIGKILSPRELGEYGMAQTVLYAPMHLITSTISRVAFPLFSKIKGDIPRLQEAILTATARSVVLIFPLYFGLLILVEEFVIVVFGNNWSSMIPLIKIMAVSFIIQSITNISGPVLISLNKTKIVLGLNVSGAIVYLLVLVILVPHGLGAIAAGYAATNSTIAFVSLGFSLHFSGIPLIKYLKCFIKPLLMSLIMIVGVYLFKNSNPSDQLISVLISSVLFGVFVYALMLAIFERQLIKQVINAIRN